MIETTDNDDLVALLSSGVVTREELTTTFYHYAPCSRCLYSDLDYPSSMYQSLR